MKTDKIRGNMKIDRHGTATTDQPTRVFCTLEIEQRVENIVVHSGGGISGCGSCGGGGGGVLVVVVVSVVVVVESGRSKWCPLLS